jgi:hypothetical protein
VLRGKGESMQENEVPTTLERQDYALEIEDIPLWLVNDAFAKVYDLLDKPDVKDTSATLVINLQALQGHQVERIQKELRKAFTVFEMRPVGS